MVAGVHAKLAATAEALLTINMTAVGSGTGTGPGPGSSRPRLTGSRSLTVMSAYGTAEAWAAAVQVRRRGNP